MFNTIIYTNFTKHVRRQRKYVLRAKNWKLTCSKNVTQKSIFLEIPVAFFFIKTDFFDHRAKSLRLEQKLVKLNLGGFGGCAFIVR